MRYRFILELLCLISCALEMSGKLIRISNSDANVRNLLKLAVPPLTSDSHKGQMGRIGIIGGSPDYTGAPYYAAQSSLKFGGDLAYIFCAKQAALPIKMYSPELMVTSFYDDDKLMKLRPSSDNVKANSEFIDGAFEMSEIIEEYMPKLHALVIGPGLGRKPQV